MMDVATQMAAILGTIVATILGLISLQVFSRDGSSSWFPSAECEPSKRSYELFVAFYTPVWITAFGVIILFQLYENFDAITYSLVCGGLALPLLLQPLLFPSAGSSSPDAARPLLQRYSFKANLWIAIYSFIGNYFYTHYFFSVLKASYSMPAHRLNNVPIALYMATHFYFSTYHFFSNAILRKIVTTFEAGFMRSLLFVSAVFGFSYFTAFMETLTISSYPYYSFEDRDMAYTIGSCFYGIYFIVSFPAFYFFDSQIDQKTETTAVSVWDTVVSSCGYGMIILILLDLVRVYLGTPLVMDVSG